MAANKKPVATFKLGRIRAAVWENDTDKGVVSNVTIERRYQDGEEWKSSTSFGRGDLPLVAKLADEAMMFIYRRQQEQAAESRQDDPVDF
jgi:hypothetical protein